MADPHGSSLTIVGIGPGDPAHLTVEARDVLARAGEVWLRTARHPGVEALPAGPEYRSFDDIYDAADSFDAVYARIVDEVLRLAARPDGVVYAVPGHPLVGESTVRGLLERAAAASIAVRIVSGVSFLDVVAAELRLDPLAEGLLLLDALQFGDHKRLLAPQRPTLIAQVYGQRAASQAKLALLDAYPAEHTARIVRAAGESPRVHEVPLARLDHDAALFDHLVTLYVPPLSLTEDVRTFEGLRGVVAKLRSPEGGCPWDLEQTHETLKRFLIEEAYEALEAIDGGEPAKMAEELGDLMMQVLLHAQLGEDAGTFVIEDVIASITAKLIRRHPHVFGDVAVTGAGEVLQNWEKLKKDERGEGRLLDHVPIALPALAQAQSVQGRAQKAVLGPQPLDRHAIARALDALAAGATGIEDTGDLLFGIVALARARDIDAEDALRAAIRRFREAVARDEDARGGGEGAP